MPFFSQAGVDAFVNNYAATPAQARQYGISLHTGDVPDLSNELSAVNAPGYARQPWTLAGTANTTPPRLTGNQTITFGPATSDWPEVRSIGLWALTDGGSSVVHGNSSLVAYLTLPDDQRFTLPSGLTRAISRSHLYLTLPPRGAASLGWHGQWYVFDDMLGLPSHARAGVTVSSLEPSGSLEVDYPDASIRSGEYLDVGCNGYQAALYTRNPLVAPTILDTPLRQGEQVYWTDTDDHKRTIPFYWSPTYHALVNYTEIITPGGDAGTATHWALWRGAPSGGSDQLLFLGELSPTIALDAGEGVSFGRRVLRAAMNL